RSREPERHGAHRHFTRQSVTAPNSKENALPNQQYRSPLDTDPSAAGAAAAGTRRYRRVIDAHVHWYPQEFVDLMIRKGPANGAVMGEDAKGNPVVVSVPGCTQKSTMRKSM